MTTNEEDAAPGEGAAGAPAEGVGACADAAVADAADVRSADGDGDVSPAGAQAGIKTQRAATAAVAASRLYRMMSPTRP